MVYDTKENTDNISLHSKSTNDEKNHESNLTLEEDQRQEYWATVKYARNQLYDYYGTACHFFPAAYGDLMRIKSMNPDEILARQAEMDLYSNE